MLKEQFYSIKNIFAVDIPPFEGRPERVRTIEDDDFLNLKIVFETAKDFNDFLSLT